MNIVGESQGGVMSRWYLKNDGSAAEADHEITFGAANHGDTPPGIDYTIVGTGYNEITAPYDLTFPRAGRDPAEHPDLVCTVNPSVPAGARRLRRGQACRGSLSGDPVR
ncbi:hypothetical protein [Nocardia terpenica]|uniref:Uncharacterized protein n=1 Tax=Nocardia terpenica TaxID=455432 RepID=A0A6G9Z2L1_9NOCA|nr:hypothetical protein [Nocardia terpenica]QIS19694.1 hypothetical protein F6W96_16745 [Nocardia terpenica]